MKEIFLGWLYKPQIECSLLENLMGALEITIVVIIIFLIIGKWVNK